MSAIARHGIRRGQKGRPAVLTSLPPGQWSVPGLAAELAMPVPASYYTRARWNPPDQEPDDAQGAQP